MPHTISILRLPWCQCLYVCTCERAYNAHTRYCRRQRMNSQRENEWIFWFRFIFDSFSLSVLVVFVGITDSVRERMCRIAWSQLIADVFKRHIVYGVAAKRAMECYQCIGETFFYSRSTCVLSIPSFLLLIFWFVCILPIAYGSVRKIIDHTLHAGSIICLYKWMK